jgi:hypothetical protein
MAKIIYDLKLTPPSPMSKDKFYDIPNGAIFTWKVGTSTNDFVYLMMDNENSRCMILSGWRSGAILEFCPCDNHTYSIVDELAITKTHEI